MAAKRQNGPFSKLAALGTGILVLVMIVGVFAGWFGPDRDTRASSGPDGTTGERLTRDTAADRLPT